MILEFEENPDSPEEELLSSAKEPQHEEAVRALLAGNRPLFMQTLAEHNMRPFSLSAFRAVADTLNT